MTRSQLELGRKAVSINKTSVFMVVYIIPKAVKIWVLNHNPFYKTFKAAKTKTGVDDRTRRLRNLFLFYFNLAK